MSGTMRTTFSPSISRIRRSTPCVEGCCGPMFRIITPSCVVSRTGVGVRWDMSAVALDGIILAQRVALQVLGHEQAAQVGMSLEAHAEQVKDLALEEVGRGPHRGDR